MNTPDWPWPNFRPGELACNSTGKLYIDPRLLDKAEALRARLGGRALIVNSAYRSALHNAKVGGAKGSQHLLGRALDISMVNHDPETFVREARALGFGGIGTYPKQNFIHIDIGPTRTWGDAFPRRSADPTYADDPDGRIAARREGTVKSVERSVTVGAGGSVGAVVIATA